MKIAYFDCPAGISGDMTLGAFLDAGLQPGLLESLPKKLHLPDVRVKISRTERCGIAAAKVRIEAPHEHVHRHLRHIHDIIDAGDLSLQAKHLAKKIFQKLAEAEARVHGTTIEKVHFHEVGALDAIFDIVGAALAYEALGITRAYAGTVSTGGGMVQCAHGLYPVPAPATALLLEGFTTRKGPVDKELTTPTGAAILAAIATPGEAAPAFRATASGYGAGDNEFETLANVLRITIGEAAANLERDTALVVECNIDDMNPQLYPLVLEKLLAAGARDAYLQPILMKKGRPGMLLAVLCDFATEASVLATIFRETTTIGVRTHTVERHKLARKVQKRPTSLGELTFKEITLPDGRLRRVPEFEACQALAAQLGLAVREVYERAIAEANSTQPGKTGKC